MIKKFEQFVNEDFTKLYKRWSGGKDRKELGTEVNTVFGKVLLENPKCNITDFYKDALEEVNDCFYNINHTTIDRNEKEKIATGKSNTDFLLTDIREGICIAFDEYERANCGDDITNKYGLDSHDYYALCRCLGEYLKNNIEVGHVNRQPGVYNMVLYSGDNVIDDDIYPFREIKDLLEEEFDIDINTWSFSYEINIGIKFSYDNVVNYNKIKDRLAEEMTIYNQ